MESLEDIITNMHYECVCVNYKFKHYESKNLNNFVLTCSCYLAYQYSGAYICQWH